MFDYGAMPTAELIDLLFKEEDRVSAAHIQEIYNRGKEPLPRLRQILQNEDYWYEGQKGDYWITYHALTIISLHGQTEDIPLLMEALMQAFFADSEWVVASLPAMLAAFGEPMTAPLMDFIQREQLGYQDNNDYSQARYKAAAALTRIASAHPPIKPAVLDFLSQFYIDPKEQDVLFLSLAADSLVHLDRKNGLQALRAGYNRNVINKRMLGSFSQFVGSLDNADHHHSYDFDLDLLDFYQPESIAERQERWQQEAAEPEQLYWEPNEARPANAPEAWSLDDEPVAPAGYEVSDKGTVFNPGKIGRNDPCPCGSGKKFKKCHGTNE